VNRGSTSSPSPSARGGDAWANKARGQGQVLLTHRTQRVRHRRRGEPPPTQVRTRNVVSPSPSQPQAWRRWESHPSGEPRGLRGEDRGASEGRSVMARRGVERTPHHSTRKRADFRTGSCVTSELGDDASHGSSSEGSRPCDWREPAFTPGLAGHPVAASPSERATCARASREGWAGGDEAPSPRLAMHAPPLAARSCGGGEASD
jgi:hypothetical protein